MYLTSLGLAFRISLTSSVFPEKAAYNNDIPFRPILCMNWTFTVILNTIPFLIMTFGVIPTKDYRSLCGCTVALFILAHEN